MINGRVHKFELVLQGRKCKVRFLSWHLYEKHLIKSVENSLINYFVNAVNTFKWFNEAEPILDFINCVHGIIWNCATERNAEIELEIPNYGICVKAINSNCQQ